MNKRRNLLSFAYITLILLSLIALYWTTGKDLGETNASKMYYADFVGYYRSGKMILSDDRTRIYDRQLQLKYFNELGAAQESSQFIYSQNPPFFFVILAPFALLPLNLSFKMWIVLSVFSAWISLHLLMKGLHNCGVKPSLMFTAAALLSAPGWICIAVGQMSWFITCLVALFFFAFLKSKNALCGLALALTTSKFQYVVLLSVPLLAQKRWKAIAWAAVFEFALLALSSLVIGLENVLNYPATLFNAETTKDYIGVFPESMISMRGILSLFLDRHQALIASSAIMFLGTIPMLWLWYVQSKINSKATISWAFAVTVCASLLLSAHTHIYDDVLLVIAAATTLPLIWQNKNTLETESSKGITICGIARNIWTFALLLFPIASWVIYIFCNNTDQVKRTPFAFLNLILLLGAAIMFEKTKKPEQSHAPE